MDVSRNDMLSELANDAALERGDFVVQATGQLHKFLDRNRDRISQLGGLTLIDEDPDYLSVSPDLTFRVRSRFEDPDTGQWTSETEIIETPSELVELYNPAEIYQAFAEAAREAAGFGEEPTATDEMLGAAGIAPDETFSIGDRDAYAGAADEWAATQAPVIEADDEESAARALYNLALDFQDRSQQSEARLIEQFEESAARLMVQLGDFIIVDDDDERLVLGAAGRFRAEVLPEDGNGEWRELKAPDEIVAYYDPTDVFGDLADAIAEAFPAVAPELEDEEGEEGDEDDADEGDEGDEADATAADDAGDAGVAADEPETGRKP